MIDRRSQSPAITDVLTDNLIGSLSYGEILTDETAAKRHRFLAAIELANLIFSINAPAKQCFVTLPTAIAAATGQLPSSENVYKLFCNDIYEDYSNAGRRFERWKRGLNTAERLSQSEGEPFYKTGGYRDVGLVLPLRGVAAGTVVAQLTKGCTNHEPHYKTELVLMGLKAVSATIASPQDDLAATHSTVSLFNHFIELRSCGSLGDGSSTGSPGFVFGDDIMPILVAAQADARRFVALPTSPYGDGTTGSGSMIDYGSAELLAEHVNHLRQLKNKYYPSGAYLTRRPLVPDE